MKRPYPEFVYGAGPDVGNFWRSTLDKPIEVDTPPDREENCDFAIIGAGFSGLSAALRLGQSGASVVVVDAQTPGWGASGRNGGFCCLGGAALSDEQIVRSHGETAAQEFAETMRAAVEGVSDLIDRLAMDVDRHSHGETMLAHTPAAMPELEAQAAWAMERLGIACSVELRDQMDAQGLSCSAMHGALTLPVGFALNPLKFTDGLCAAIRQAGTRIFANFPVTQISQTREGRFQLSSTSGSLIARKLIFATNGYSSDDLPAQLSGAFLPTQSSVLVTRPLTDIELARQNWTSRQMCFDTRRFLHYFRLMPDNRMLFGMRGGANGSASGFATERQRIKDDFCRFFPEWGDVETPFFWSGLLCLRRSLTPFVGPVPGMDGAFAAFAYHGNGVAMANASGRMAAEMALGLKPKIPVVMTLPPRRFPLGRGRRFLVSARGAWDRMQDMRG